jgi:hypothetical protein
LARRLFDNLKRTLHARGAAISFLLFKAAVCNPARINALALMDFAPQFSGGFGCRGRAQGRLGSACSNNNARESCSAIARRSITSAHS